MNKVLQRLLIFFIGIPAVLAFVFIKAYNHLPLHILIIVVSIVSVTEIYRLIKQGQHVQPYFLTATLAALLPATAAICALFSLPYTLIDFVLIFDFFVILCAEIFPCGAEKCSPDPFEHSIQKILTSLFTVFYGSYLITFPSRMTGWPDSHIYITIFLIMTFLCDSFAWFFGVLFGKGNRGILKVSPNKSAAGFLGGFLGSIGTALAAAALFPSFCQGSYLAAFILGALVAAAAIIGDLAESVLKRSARCKDSGSIILGRGGILDSIDSILLAAPVYYIVLMSIGLE